MKSLFRKRNAGGFTIIEVLVSLAMAMVLILSINALLGSTMVNKKFLEKSAAAEELAKETLNYLTKYNAAGTDATDISRNKAVFDSLSNIVNASTCPSGSSSSNNLVCAYQNKDSDLALKIKIYDRTTNWSYLSTDIKNVYGSQAIYDAIKAAVKSRFPNGNTVINLVLSPFMNGDPTVAADVANPANYSSTPDKLYVRAEVEWPFRTGVRTTIFHTLMIKSTN